MAIRPGMAMATALAMANGSGYDHSKWPPTSAVAVATAVGHDIRAPSWDRTAHSGLDAHTHAQANILSGVAAEPFPGDPPGWDCGTWWLEPEMLSGIMRKLCKDYAKLAHA